MEDNTVTLRIPLDRPPTLQDRSNKVGMEQFMQLLYEKGWSDKEYNALVPMTITYEGHDVVGDYYIEWKAVRDS